MVMNIIKAGGYMLMLNELANQVKEIQRSREKARHEKNRKSLMLGAGIGTVLGVTAGILFAPKSGKETRQIIADRTGESARNLKDRAAATREKISESARQTGSKVQTAAKKGAEAAKESLKENEKEKPKK